MRLDRLETHDRLLDVQKKNLNTITSGLEECIKNRPAAFTHRHFYIHVHKRTVGLDEKIAILQQDIREVLLNPLLNRRFHRIEDIPELRVIYMPRATRPIPSENSMLFRCFPQDGNALEPIWIIPEESTWPNYAKGMIMNDEFIAECIEIFKTNPSFFCKTDELDYNEEELKKIRIEIGKEAHAAKQENPFTLI